MIRVLCKLRSLGLHGVTGYEVTAECDLSGGLPNFEKVGSRVQTYYPRISDYL